MSKREKVLMVDDDLVQLSVVGGWLRGGGFEVLTLNSPFGVARMVMREQPDVVLLDLGMPGLEGQFIADNLRRMVRAQDTAIIFYSGKDEAALREVAENHDVLGVIRKTHDGRVFLAELRRLLDQRKGKGEG